MQNDAHLHRPSDGSTQNEQLSAHIQKFVSLTRALDSSVTNKDDEATLQKKNELDQFYGTCTPAEQNDIRVFVQRQIIGKTIEDERSKVNSTIVRVLHLPQRVVGSVVEPIAKLSEETVRLVVMTIGLTTRGFYRGIRDIFQKAA